TVFVQSFTIAWRVSRSQRNSKSEIGTTDHTEYTDRKKAWFSSVIRVIEEVDLDLGLFFTGTDTGVGKTFVTAAVARILRRRGCGVVVCKPVAAGADWK